MGDQVSKCCKSDADKSMEIFVSARDLKPTDQLANMKDINNLGSLMKDIMDQNQGMEEEEMLKLIQTEGLVKIEEQLMDDGSMYSGYMRGDQKRGHGILVWLDGSKYEGMWNND